MSEFDGSGYMGGNVGEGFHGGNQNYINNAQSAQSYASGQASQMGYPSNNMTQFPGQVQQQQTPQPMAQQSMMQQTYQPNLYQQQQPQMNQFQSQGQFAQQQQPMPQQYMPNQTAGMYAPQLNTQQMGMQQTVQTGMPAAESMAGSYAARSAQAYAAVGAPMTPSVITTSVPAGVQPMTPVASMPAPSSSKSSKYAESPIAQAQQNRVLTDCTRKVQENAYYMKQAMDKDDLPTVLDRAAHMVGELGDTSSGQISPKNYYELHMRALDDMPNLEEYLLGLTTQPSPKHKMKDLYCFVQFCPKVLPRLYLQISAGSALIRSKEESAKWVLNDLIEAVKCVQNPLRGLFLRHFLLQATRDKLPDGDDVKDGYEFVLANFIEMNKLWVRIQHLPGEGKSKEQRKKRERERNELRILVGTNLVRLSQLDGVTSKIYGEVILPKILEQVTACGDPLAQAYLIDCIIQVFPDEYHIETLSILLSVCPKLRDKVNIRTILQSLMDRLANYYAEEELLPDEADTNDVKKSVFQESFPMFENCVRSVFHARGPKLAAKEVIRLQTALLNFSLKCYAGNMIQLNRCLGVCIEYIRQSAQVGALASQETLPDDASIELDEASVAELEKMLSIPLDSLALKVLELDHYSDLLQFLPWENRRDVGMEMLNAIDACGGTPRNVKELEELFSIVDPVIKIKDDGFGDDDQEEINLISKLVHMLKHDDMNVTYEMLEVARTHLHESAENRTSDTLVPVVFSALRLADMVSEVKKKSKEAENGEGKAKTDNGTENNGKEKEGDPENSPEDTTDGDEPEETSGEADGEAETETKEETPLEEQPNTEEEQPSTISLSCRKIFVFIQTTITMIGKSNAELAVKLFLNAALSADALYDANAPDEGFEQITHELFVQAFFLHDEEINEHKSQRRCVINMVAALLACHCIPNKDYENLVTKAAQYAAKLLKKEDQCEMVTLCAHLFFPVGRGEGGYSNPQRTLECLQRALKLADASTMATPASVYLFVDLLEHYVHFFENGNPVITEAYVTGLIALIREHLETAKSTRGASAGAIADADAQFQQVISYIQRKKDESDCAEKFKLIKIQ